jgi:uncharacterized membrane protein YhaH (DUF805 family)
MKNIFSLSGRASRQEYFFIFIALALFWVGLGYLMINVFHFSPLTPYFFEIRFIFDLLSIATFTPIMTRRLHDINLPGYLVIFYWVSALLNTRNTIYLQKEFNYFVDPYAIPIFVLDIAVLIIVIILFVYKSYPHSNKWSNPNNKINKDNLLNGQNAPIE